MSFRIAPSILSADFARLGEEVEAVVRAGADLVHFDVMDNHYVPNLTVGPMVCKAIKPHTKVPIDVHLMVKPVDALVPAFAEAGANIISFHPEASEHVDRTLQLIRASGCKAGLVFNPATPLSWLDHVMDRIDLVLIMSVNPGFGGQTFIEEALVKLRAARERIDRSGRDIWLEVDGGVNVSNIGRIAAAGADTFVAGSAIFDGKGDYAATIRAMRTELGAARGARFPLPVKAVTIDLDGTLLDTIPDLAAASNLMLKELGRPPLELDLIRTFVGKGISRLVERTLAASFGGEPDPALLQSALTLFERFYTETNGRHTTIYPGVMEGLDRLRAQRFPLACVTNKSGRFTQPLLEAIGLSPYFESVVCGDTLARKKPDPAPLLHACDALKVKPADMLMIGDSQNDTQAARAAGCPVFCVTYGYSEGRDVRDLDTDALIDSLADAPGLICKA